MKVKKPLIDCLGVKVLPQTADLIEKLPKEKQRITRKILEAKQVEAGDRSEVSVITTDALDRDGDVINPEGINLDHFRDNPIALFMHQWDNAVGRIEWIKPTDNGLKAKFIYPPKPKDYEGEWKPDLIWGMIQAGILKGKSISYIEIESHPPTTEEIQTRPELEKCRKIVDKCLLLEVSVVTIPSNPEALIAEVGKAPKKNVGGKLLKKLSGEAIIKAAMKKLAG